MSCTNANNPPQLKLQQIPQLPDYPNMSSQGDKEAVVDQYRNDLNRALYKNFQTLNNALNPTPGTNGTNGSPGGGGGGIVGNVSGVAPIVVSNGNSNPIVSITDFVASGASHARGAVPDPGASSGTTKFLREDATWAVPSGGSGWNAIIAAKVFGRT